MSDARHVLLQLIQEKLLVPGAKKLYVSYYRKRVFADLLLDGSIRFQDVIYMSPVPCALQMKRTLNPSLKTDAGWSTMFSTASGNSLKEIKDRLNIRKRGPNARTLNKEKKISLGTSIQNSVGITKTVTDSGCASSVLRCSVCKNEALSEYSACSMCQRRTHSSCLPSTITPPASTGWFCDECLTEQAETTIEFLQQAKALVDGGGIDNKESFESIINQLICDLSTKTMTRMDLLTNTTGATLVHLHKTGFINLLNKGRHELEEAQAEMDPTRNHDTEGDDDGETHVGLEVDALLRVFDLRHQIQRSADHFGHTVDMLSQRSERRMCTVELELMALEDKRAADNTKTEHVAQLVEHSTNAIKVIDDTIYWRRIQLESIARQRNYIRQQNMCNRFTPAYKNCSKRLKRSCDHLLLTIWMDKLKSIARLLTEWETMEVHFETMRERLDEYGKNLLIKNEKMDSLEGKMPKLPPNRRLMERQLANYASNLTKLRTNRSRVRRMLVSMMKVARQEQLSTELTETATLLIEKCGMDDEEGEEDVGSDEIETKLEVVNDDGTDLEEVQYMTMNHVVGNGKGGVDEREDEPDAKRQRLDEGTSAQGHNSGWGNYVSIPTSLSQASLPVSTNHSDKEVKTNKEGQTPITNGMRSLSTLRSPPRHLTNSSVTFSPPVNQYEISSDEDSHVKGDLDSRPPNGFKGKTQNKAPLPRGGNHDIQQQNRGEQGFEPSRSSITATTDPLLVPATISLPTNDANRRSWSQPLVAGPNDTGAGDHTTLSCQSGLHTLPQQQQPSVSTTPSFNCSSNNRSYQQLQPLQDDSRNPMISSQSHASNAERYNLHLASGPSAYDSISHSHHSSDQGVAVGGSAMALSTVPDPSLETRGIARPGVASTQPQHGLRPEHQQYTHQNHPHYHHYPHQQHLASSTVGHRATTSFMSELAKASKPTDISVTTAMPSTTNVPSPHDLFGGHDPHQPQRMFGPQYGHNATVISGHIHPLVGVSSNTFNPSERSGAGSNTGGSSIPSSAYLASMNDPRISQQQHQQAVYYGETTPHHNHQSMQSLMNSNHDVYNLNQSTWPGNGSNGRNQSQSRSHFDTSSHNSGARLYGENNDANSNQSLDADLSEW